MSSLLFSILLFVIGIIIYMSKAQIYILHYLILWVCFAPLLYHLFWGLTDEIQYYNIIQWIKYLGVFIFINSIFRERDNNFFLFYLLLAIVLFYSLFLSIIRQNSVVETVKFVFGTFFEVMVLLGLYHILVEKKRLLVLIRLILWIEILCGIIQALTGITFFWRSEGVVGTEICGTFRGANLMAEFITVLLYLLLYIDSYKKKRISPYNWLLFCLVSILIFYSGIRMALLAHVVIGTIFIVKVYDLLSKIKRKIVPISILCSLLLLLLYYVFSSYLSTAEVTYDSNVTSAVERQNVLTSIFLQEDYLSEHTTMYYTIFVLSFFHLNPLLGPGLLFQSPAGYGGVVNSAAGNLTDCTMALYICESGLIGVLLFIMIYRNVLRKLCVKTGGAKLLFYYLLIITITDPGLFFIGNYLGFIAFILIEKQDELSKRRLQKVL